MTKIARWMIPVLFVMHLAACATSGDNAPFTASTDPGEGDSSLSTETTSSGDSETSTDTGGEAVDTDPYLDTNTEDDVCADWNVALDNRPANVMLLEDVSASMVQDENLAEIPPPNKWSFARDAITALVTANEDEINFGLDIFSNAPFDDDVCSVRNGVLVDTAPANSEQIIAAMDQISPKGKTPLYLAMNRFNDDAHAPLFMSEAGRQFLVIVSDGKDTCDPDGPDETGREDGASAFQLEDLTVALREDSGISTIVIGFGSGIDAKQLNAIAAQGGTDFTSYLVAQDAASLQAAFDEIAWAVIGCEYDLGEYDPQGVDLDKVNFLFDDKKVEQDKGCKVDKIGWTWANDDKTAISFCTDACNMLKNHEVDDISAVIGCPDIAPVK